MTTAAQTRLQHAERLLEQSVNVDLWARCATWLIRLALEHALNRLWQARQPELVACPMRAQLLALGKFRNPDITSRVTELWQTLSWAAHHHPYELAPSAREIQGWLDEARLLIAELT
jgi:hypothetical protein